MNLFKHVKNTETGEYKNKHDIELRLGLKYIISKNATEYNV